MRKLLLVLVSAAVGSIITAIVLEPRAAAIGGQDGALAACSTKNGDVNADGNVDVSDAVAILGNLFLGSPAELSLLCAPPPATSGLPDTGLKHCYDDLGSVLERSECFRFCSGQDGSYATGCPSQAALWTTVTTR